MVDLSLLIRFNGPLFRVELRNELAVGVAAEEAFGLADAPFEFDSGVLVDHFGGCREDAGDGSTPTMFLQVFFPRSEGQVGLHPRAEEALVDLPDHAVIIKFSTKYGKIEISKLIILNN